MNNLFIIIFAWLIILTILHLEIKSTFVHVMKSVNHLQDIAIMYLKDCNRQIKDRLAQKFEEKLKKEYKDESESKV